MTFRWALVLVLWVAAFAHLRSLGGEFVCDDDFVLSQAIAHPLGEWEGRPVRTWTVAFDRFFWRQEAFGFHLTNLLLHMAVSAGVLLLARRLARDLQAGLWAGLLFAAHPAFSEAVANIANRKDLLAAFFSLVSILAFLKGTRGARAVSLAAFALALGSKESAVVLPIFLLLCDACDRRGWRGVRAGDHLPFWGIVVMAAWLFGLKEAALAGGGHTRYWMEGLTASETFRMAGASLLDSARLLAFPVRLGADQPLPTAAPWGAIVLAAAAALAGWGFCRAPRGPGFIWGAAWFCWGWAASSILLSASAFPVAERYLVLSAIGAAIALGAGIASAARSRPGWGLAAALVLCFAALAQRHDRAWNRSETVWKQSLAVNPRSLLAQAGWGETCGRYQEPDRAGRAFTRAARIHPDDPQVETLWAQMLWLNRRHDAAGDHYRRAAELQRRQGLPASEPLEMLYRLARARGRAEEAEEWLRQLREIDPKLARELSERK